MKCWVIILLIKAIVNQDPIPPEETATVTCSSYSLSFASGKVHPLGLYYQVSCTNNAAKGYVTFRPQQTIIGENDTDKGYPLTNSLQIQSTSSNQTISYTYSVYLNDVKKDSCQEIITLSVMTCNDDCLTCSTIPTDPCILCDNYNKYYKFIDAENNIDTCYLVDSEETIGLYLDGTQFKRCHRSCLKCLIGGNDLHTNCVECKKSEKYFPLKYSKSQCAKWSDKIEYYYYDEAAKEFGSCFYSCKFCTTLGTIDQSRCTECREQHLPLLESVTQCFNETTIPEYYYIKNDTLENGGNKYDRCFESCGKCEEKGTLRNSKCKKCATGYFPEFQMPTNCYNEITKPPNTMLNEMKEYQSCLQNILCGINCDGKTQRWYIDDAFYITCTQDLHCYDKWKYYHIPMNQCSTDCPIYTIPDPLTETCIQCSGNAKYYDSDLKACLSKCEEGKYANSLNLCMKCPLSAPAFYQGTCLEKCPDNSVNAICSPCKSFYNSFNKCVDKCGIGEDYDINKLCIKKIEVDSGFDLMHNPIRYQFTQLKYYSNQTKETDYKDIMERMLTTIEEKFNTAMNNKLIEEDMTKRIIDDANELIFFAQMVKTKVGSATVDEVSSLYSRAIEIWKKMLNTNIALNYDQLLTLILTQYYFMTNQMYITTKTLDDIKDLQQVLFEHITKYTQSNNPSSYTLIKEKQEILSILNVIYTLISNTHSDNTKNDPKYDYLYFKHLFYRIKNAFVHTESNVKMREYAFNYALFTYKLNNNSSLHTLVKSNLFDILNYPISSINYIENSPIQVTTNCIDNSDIISKMKGGNSDITICLPISDVILQSYPDAEYISIIKYNKQYPLLNPNVTEINPLFISVNFMSKSQKPISINSFKTGEKIRIFINTNGQKENEYSQCIYYNEQEHIPAPLEGSEPISETYIICTTTHLTDLSTSKVDVVTAMLEGNLDYLIAKIIYSTIAFRMLNYCNATMIYIWGGILLLYLILLPFAMVWDKKTYANRYYDIVDKELSWMNKTIIYTGVDYLRSLIKVYSIQNGSWIKTIVKLDTPKDINDKEPSDIDNSRRPSNKPQSVNIADKSTQATLLSLEVPLGFFCYLLRSFISNEYRLLYLFMGRPSVLNKVDHLTLFFFRKFLILTFTGIFATCRKDNTLPFQFGPMDFVVIFPCVIMTDILYTIFELLLSRTEIEDIKNYHVRRIQMTSFFNHVIVYLIAITIVGFGLYNTLWVSLELINQELSTMFYEDLALAIMFDVIGYEFLILLFKALIYFFIIKYKAPRVEDQNKAGCFMSFIIQTMAFCPWLFIIRWESDKEKSVNNTAKSNDSSK